MTIQYPITCNFQGAGERCVPLLDCFEHGAVSVDIRLRDALGAVGHLDGGAQGGVDDSFEASVEAVAGGVEDRDVEGDVGFEGIVFTSGGGFHSIDRDPDRLDGLRGGAHRGEA